MRSFEPIANTCLPNRVYRSSAATRIASTITPQIPDGSRLSPRVTRRLIGEFATRSRPSAGRAAERLAPLTDREREVVALVGEGLSNDEIADRLVVSPATAKTHVSRAMVKLQVRDRAHLVVLAYESGLVRPGWSDG